MKRRKYKKAEFTTINTSSEVIVPSGVVVSYVGHDDKIHKYKVTDQSGNTLTLKPLGFVDKVLMWLRGICFKLTYIFNR